MIGRWWERWIWSGERRRHGQTVREVLAAWRPSGWEPPPGSRAGAPPWARDEELVTAVLGLLWQGATERDLARWLERGLAGRHRLDPTPGEVSALARALVARYEERLFGEESPDSS